MQLSVLIPARNEEFLKRTVEDILSHIEGETEVIVVLDGYTTELPNDPRIKVIHNEVAKGQRAATNQACRLSEAKYVMKTDAHVSFEQGFDVKMLEAFKETGDNVTMVPVMKNLHAFDWVCEDGHRRYQSPSGPCTECGKPTIKDVVWIAKKSPNSRSYCFDSEPHFQYNGEYTHRPEYKKDFETGITETMSLQGSCFMLTREKYWELNICDEAMGSWGSQGIEVAVKTWLSGGRVVCNQKTWYAHLFRTAGGDFGFPYPQSGSAVHSAKKFARELFFNNQWPLQVRPLSWLLERFWPVKGWTESELKILQEAGAIFTNLRAEKLRILGVVPIVPSPVTDKAPSVSSDSLGQEMPVPTVSLSGISGSSTTPSQDILSIRDEPQVGGITTGTVITDVVKDRNIPTLSARDRADEPHVDKPMSSIQNLINPDLPIAVVQTPNPIPTSGNIVYSNLLKQSIDSIGSDVHDTSISKTAGIVYFSDVRIYPRILKECQDQIIRAFTGPIVSATLKPIDFGKNIHLPLERGQLTMFKQILAGLEALDTDYVFLCDDDVLYHPSHFEFVPPRDDVFYYNLNWWRLRTSDGFAVNYEAKQSNFLCANRQLMIREYKERVRRVEAEGWQNGGYEPGTKSIRRGGFGDSPSATYTSKYPSIDIRHGMNLTHSKWKPEDFRQSRSCRNWKETTVDKIEGWDNLRGILDASDRSTADLTQSA